MNSLEFIVPQNFLFIFTNFSFIFFCFILTYVISRIINSRIVFILLFVGLSSIAYYDLFVKYAVKSYYELTQNEFKKVNQNNQALKNSLMSSSNDKSKLKVEKSIQPSFLPSVFINQEYKFIDKSTNEVVASATNISFIIEHHKFRNKYLYWGFEQEDEYNPDSIENFNYIYKKVFADVEKGSVK